MLELGCVITRPSVVVISPLTSSLAPGLVVPMPTLPAPVIRASSELVFGIEPELPVELDLNIILPPAAVPVLNPAVRVKSLPAALAPLARSAVIAKGELLSELNIALVELPSPICNLYTLELTVEKKRL
jgi:hypothetical protein